MRREGKRYGVRTNQTVKFCFQCLNGEHNTKGLASGVHAIREVNVVVFRSIPQKPKFCCKSNHGHHGRCWMCSYHPFSKSAGKVKGRNKKNQDRRAEMALIL